MEESIPIFENKFANYLKELEEDYKIICENLRLIGEGKIRVGYFNDISEKIIKMQQMLSAIKHLSIRKEVIGLEIGTKLNKILAIAIEQAKQEAASADKNPDDPLGLHEDPLKPQ